MRSPFIHPFTVSRQQARADPRVASDFLNQPQYLVLRHTLPGNRVCIHFIRKVDRGIERLGGEEAKVSAAETYADRILLFPQSL